MVQSIAHRPATTLTTPSIQPPTPSAHAGDRVGIEHPDGRSRQPSAHGTSGECRSVRLFGALPDTLRTGG